MRRHEVFWIGDTVIAKLIGKEVQASIDLPLVSTTHPKLSIELGGRRTKKDKLNGGEKPYWLGI